MVSTSVCVCVCAPHTNPLDDALEMMNSYLDKQRLRGRKSESLRSYRHIITCSLRFLYENGYCCDPERIDEECIHYLMNNYDASENTIKHYLVVLNKFLRIMVNNTVIESMDLLWNKNESTNVVFIEKEDFRKLWECATDPVDRGILLLGGRCGLRRCEISKLKVTDIVGNDLIVRGKGHGDGKVRRIPLTPDIKRELELLIEYRKDVLSRENDRTCGMLLFTIFRKAARPLSNPSVFRKIRQLGERAGVRVTTHSLRRFFATDLSEFLEIHELKDALGHVSISTTAIYIRTDKDKIREAISIRDKEYI